MQRFELAALTVILLLAGVMTPVHAATTFTDPGAFELATGGSTLLDDYNDFTSLTFFSAVQDRGDYQIVTLAAAPAGAAGSSAVNINGTGFILVGTGGSARFEFDTPIAAVGFDYATGGITPEVDVISGSFSERLGRSGFFGVIFDAPVTSFTVVSDRTDSIRMDNLRAVPIPEPTSMSLAMVGIGTLLLRRQRRARARRRK